MHTMNPSEPMERGVLFIKDACIDVMQGPKTWGSRSPSSRTTVRCFSPPDVVEKLVLDLHGHAKVDAASAMKNQLQVGLLRITCSNPPSKWARATFAIGAVTTAWSCGGGPIIIESPHQGCRFYDLTQPTGCRVVMRPPE